MCIQVLSSRASDETSVQVGGIENVLVEDMAIRLEALENTRCGPGSIFQFDIGMYSQLKEPV